MYQTLAQKVALPQVLEALPSRSWVTALEVQQALNLKGSAWSVGAKLGALGLVRTCVRVGRRSLRVWLIRGEPQDFAPADVRAELIAHGFPAPQTLERGQGRGTVVSLTKLAPKPQEPLMPGPR